MSSRDKISLEEACAFLECAIPKLMELLGDGTIPGLKYGKAWVIPRQAFLDSVNKLAFEASESIRKVARSEAEAARMTHYISEAQISRAGRARTYRSA